MFDIECPGQTGHGSLLHENTAGEKLSLALQKFLDFREKEKRRLQLNPDFTIGDVTTLNLTIINVSISFLGMLHSIIQEICKPKKGKGAQKRRPCASECQCIELKLRSFDKKISEFCTV